MFHPFDPRDSVSSGGREQSEGICVIHPKTKNVVRRVKVDPTATGGALSTDPKIDLKQSNLEKAPIPALSNRILSLGGLSSIDNSISLSKKGGKVKKKNSREM
jgi:hypothetical protein